MATTRRVKKNIKEDQLVTFAVQFSEWAQRNFNYIIIGVVVLVGAIAVVVFTANSREGARQQADIQLGSAMSLFSQGEFASAKASFQQIIDAHGGGVAAKALYFRGECDLRQNNYAPALESYNGYLADYRDFPMFRESAMAGKAICQDALGQPAEAAATLVELLDILPEEDPRYLDNAFRAGELFAKAGNTEQAAEYFNEVAENGSGDLKAKASVAATLLGQ